MNDDLICDVCEWPYYGAIRICSMCHFPVKVVENKNDSKLKRFRIREDEEEMLDM